MGRKQNRGRKHLHFCLAGLIFLFLAGCATPEKVKIMEATPQERVEVTPQENAEKNLRRARERFDQKDFEGALKGYQEIFSVGTYQPSEGEASYMIGLIYVHPEYPKRNVMKALYYFNRVITDYPKSFWAGQSSVWVGILQENGKLGQNIENLERRTKQLQMDKAALMKEKKEKEARQPLVHGQELFAQGKYEEASRELQKLLSLSPRYPWEDEVLFKIGLVYAHPGNSKKDYGKSIIYFKRLAKDYPQSLWSEVAKTWTGMIQEIEKLNQAVDRLNQTIEKTKQVDIEIEEKKREKGK